MAKVARVSKSSKSGIKKSIVKVKTASIVEGVTSKVLVKTPVVSVSNSNTRLEELSSMIATGVLSRGKRKRAMKRATIESRKAFVTAALSAKKAADDVTGFGQALGNFAELVEAVQPVEELPKPEVVDRRKKWQKGALKRGEKAKADNLDITRFQTLMAIPEFAKDPIAAIEQHMLNIKRKQDTKQENLMQI